MLLAIISKLHKNIKGRIVREWVGDQTLKSTKKCLRTHTRVSSEYETSKFRKKFGKNIKSLSRQVPAHLERRLVLISPTITSSELFLGFLSLCQTIWHFLSIRAPNRQKIEIGWNSWIVVLIRATLAVFSVSQKHRRGVTLSTTAEMSFDRNKKGESIERNNFRVSCNFKHILSMQWSCSTLFSLTLSLFYAHINLTYRLNIFFAAPNRSMQSIDARSSIAFSAIQHCSIFYDFQWKIFCTFFLIF